MNWKYSFKLTPDVQILTKVKIFPKIHQNGIPKENIFKKENFPENWSKMFKIISKMNIFLKSHQKWPKPSVKWTFWKILKFSKTLTKMTKIITTMNTKRQTKLFNLQTDAQMKILTKFWRKWTFSKKSHQNDQNDTKVTNKGSRKLTFYRKFIKVARKFNQKCSNRPQKC